MLIIPAIDLRAGRVVRLVEGRDDSVTFYETDPVAVALQYETEGARLIHVVDLDAAFQVGGSVNRQIIGDIARAVTVPIEVGGGIRTLGDIENLIQGTGARHAIVGTLAVEQPDLVAEAVRTFGDSILVGIDARGLEVSVRGWTHHSALDAVSLARRMADIGVQRIIYTDITRDGKLQGPNLENTRQVALASGVRVTASGGISSMEDLRRLAELETDGCDSCVVGKAIYEGRFTVSEAIKAYKN
ncbi:MAG TPA: 1-(5-phosphoribosyl)-5-[(5-phosphoribosylamino)methylideneamino]imidazole-4-carboxamide isomerase [Blastocatellia bacterium]|nr:1-(5-phosphoribosyl)-5-[(5-phosphoribosylamino)methylideneamino]imidazole-4-carboxamide isomerase [Blastocatellia bacterium]